MYIRNEDSRVYAQENEAGAEPAEVVDQTTEQGGTEGQEPETLRQQLEKNFEADKKGTQDTKPEVREKKGGYTSRARQAAAEDTKAAPAAGEAEDQQQQQQQVAPAPEAFSKEAKAEWAKVPAPVQQAILKREQDVTKGVQELKERYADIDRAIAPHMEAIRRHGQTPAAAVNQLFSWFQALASNPKESFPALARSFGWELGQFVPQQAQQQQPQAGQEGQPQPQEIPPYVKEMDQKLEMLAQAFGQQLQGVQQTFAQQSQAKTQEILDNWSKGKPHFQEVRELMAQLIASGAVPLNNGQVDLDAAYDRAVYAHPDIRAKLIAEMEAAKQKAAADKAETERKAQEAQANKARKAGISVGSGAPGAQNAQSAKKGGKGKSVRESIMEAREQLTS